MGLVAKHIDFTFPVVGRERAVPVWAISLCAVAVVLSDELNLVCAEAANCYSYTYANKLLRNQYLREQEQSDFTGLLHLMIPTFLPCSTTS